jgi:hypothetical protein
VAVAGGAVIIVVAAEEVLDVLLDDRLINAVILEMIFTSMDLLDDNVLDSMVATGVGVGVVADDDDDDALENACFQSLRIFLERAANSADAC